MRYPMLALAVIALAGCRADAARETASTAAALPFLPVPPQAEVVSRAGSADAVQITFRSKSSPGEVLSYYRVLLPRSGWSLESDAEDAVGAMALYALKDGHPMWIRISQAPGMPLTIVEISGAVVLPDTQAATPAAEPPPAT
ncbi:MAG TPA: hypothetical protein VFV65_05125 [Gemmatimonadales bacterium]|nr:hypothetical protein [Gemmatimonadales bacterium]